MSRREIFAMALDLSFLPCTSRASQASLTEGFQVELTSLVDAVHRVVQVVEGNAPAVPVALPRCHHQTEGRLPVASLLVEERDCPNCDSFPGVEHH
ncbi:MAG: hypothetical protein ACI4TU_05430 [Candidatus Cryptobacteroides sp.]